ncbi:MAG: assimilatory sulfite reductase (NADPH) flavoprotein subunit [Marinilabilia sp.]
MSAKLSPFEGPQLEALEQLTKQLTPEQTTWLSGYFQGLLNANAEKGADPKNKNSSAGKDNPPLTILYGTHTGRSEAIAKKLHDQALNRNFRSNLFAMDNYKARNLKNEKNLLIIVSTHGEGEPPLMAEDFHHFVTGRRIPKLGGLNYSVLALGDKSYKHFCKTGIDIDQALSRAGAEPLTPIVTCDVDYEMDADRWIDSVFTGLAKNNPPSPHAETQEIGENTKPADYSRKHPFEATVLEKVRITGSESDKEVYHLEISLEDSGITYEPGDALGIIAQNPDNLVQEILATLDGDGSEAIDTHAGNVTMRNALKHHYEITVLTRDVLKKYAEKTGDTKVREIVDDESKLEAYLFGHDVLDLLHEFPGNMSLHEFIELLRPLPPRLYSISSSQEAVGEEVHITVSKVQYQNKGRERLGACSGFLAEQLDLDDKVLVYIEKNHNFRLPSNGNPIIMVGAGTGIAPYRAFLQHRETTGQKGKSWLFFGDRRFSSDFLYQVEWQKFLNEGYLEKIDLAFSRDQEEKLYVQHQLRKQQKQLYEWIEKGAFLYLCGDMTRMAKDVETTLKEIVENQGGMTPERSEEFIHQLKKEKRFQSDVY